MKEELEMKKEEMKKDFSLAEKFHVTKLFYKVSRAGIKEEGWRYLHLGISWKDWIGYHLIRTIR